MTKMRQSSFAALTMLYMAASWGASALPLRGVGAHQHTVNSAILNFQAGDGKNNGFQRLAGQLQGTRKLLGDTHSVMISGTEHMITEVQTADELYTAFQEGAEHILITEHIWSAENMVVNNIPSSVRTIRGNCETPPDWAPTGTPLLPFKPGQCLVMNLQQVNVARTNVWMHNLYLRYNTPHLNPSGHFGEKNWSHGRTEAIKVDGGDLWMTDLILQGDGQTVTNSMTFAVSGGGRAFLQGCVFADLGAHWRIIQMESDITIVDCTITRCTCPANVGDVWSKGTTVFFFAPRSSQAVGRLQGLVLDNNVATTDVMGLYWQNQSSPPAIYSNGTMRYHQIEYKKPVKVFEMDTKALTDEPERSRWNGISLDSPEVWYWIHNLPLPAPTPAPAPSPAPSTVDDSDHGVSPAPVPAPEPIFIAPAPADAPVPAPSPAPTPTDASGTTFVSVNTPAPAPSPVSFPVVEPVPSTGPPPTYIAPSPGREYSPDYTPAPAPAPVWHSDPTPAFAPQPSMAPAPAPAWHHAPTPTHAAHAHAHEEEEEESPTLTVVTDGSTAVNIEGVLPDDSAPIVVTTDVMQDGASMVVNNITADSVNVYNVVL